MFKIPLKWLLRCDLVPYVDFHLNQKSCVEALKGKLLCHVTAALMKVEKRKKEIYTI